MHFQPDPSGSYGAWKKFKLKLLKLSLTGYPTFETSDNPSLTWVECFLALRRCWLASASSSSPPTVLCFSGPGYKVHILSVLFSATNNKGVDLRKSEQIIIQQWKRENLFFKGDMYCCDNCFQLFVISIISFLHFCFLLYILIFVVVWVAKL